jgi:ketosteroid isomerase-like protein
MEREAADGAISESRATFVAALRAGDAKGASAVYALDARLLPPSAELMEGRTAIEAFWQAGIDAGLSAVELELLNLEGGERIAYEIGRYALHLRPADGKCVVDRGKYVLVHERQDDGRWRRAVEMFNPDAPPSVRPNRRERP